MKSNIKVSALKAALEFAAKPISQRTTLLVLSTVKLSARPGLMAITGTDLDSEFFSVVECETKTPGEMLLNASMLRKICNQGETASFDASDKAATVLVDDCGYTFTQQDEGEFPRAMDTADAKRIVELDAAEFIAGLRLVAPYMSTDESRYAINCVYVEVTEDFVFLVATDGRRLIVHKLKRQSIGGSGNFTIIRNVVEKLSEEEWSGNVNLFWPGEKHFSNIVIQTNTRGVVAKQIEANFPNYKQVIPASGSILRKIGVLKQIALDKVLQVAAVMAEDKGMLIKITNGVMTFETDKFSEHKALVGVAHTELAGTKYTLQTAINPRYLVQALKSVSDPFTIEFASERDPLVFTDAKTQVVVMPVRIT